MTEGIGLAASLITIGAFSHTLADVSEKVYTAAHNGEEISGDMRYFASSVKFAGDSFSYARDTLEDLSVDNSDISRYLSSQSVLTDMQHSIEALNKAFVRLYPLLEDIRSQTGVASFWTRVQWLRKHKDYFTELILKTKFLETTITMMLIVFLVQQNVKDAKQTKDKVFSNRLEKEKRRHKRKLRQLERQVEQQGKDIRQLENSVDADFRTIPIRALTKAIVSLSSSMRRYERVPPASSTSSAARVFFRAEPGLTSGSTWRDASVRSAGPARSRERKTQSSSGRSRRPTSFKKVPDVTDRPVSRNSLWTEYSDEIHLNDEGHLDNEKDNPAKDPMSENTAPQTAMENVSAQEEILKADLKACTPVGLWISLLSRFNGLTSVAGQLCSSLPANIISLAAAQKYRIRFDDTEERRPSQIRLSTGERFRILGKTELVYVRLSESSVGDTVSLRFLVFDSYQPEVILGSPFLSARDFLRGSGSIQS